MKTIRKVTLYVEIDEEDIDKAFKEYADTLPEMADNQIDFDLKDILAPEKRWQNFSWRIEKVGEDDIDDFEFKKVVQTAIGEDLLKDYDSFEKIHLKYHPEATPDELKEAYKEHCESIDLIGFN